MQSINELGAKIKAIREKKAFSQSEVVEKLMEKNINMSRETLSKIENGNRSISAVELNALCNILGIDINSLFNEDDDLVTLFRKRNFSESTINEVEKLQDMIKVFIYQKKIYNGEFKPIKRKPLWEEC
jgi:transcriptional regulator with XRE-family HTH domain